MPYHIKDSLTGKIEEVKPGTTFQMKSGAQFRMLASGSLIRADRSRKKLNKKERRLNRIEVKKRTEKLRAEVEAYEKAVCICSHTRLQHKNDEGPCIGCTCAKFVEEVKG